MTGPTVSRVGIFGLILALVIASVATAGQTPTTTAPGNSSGTDPATARLAVPTPPQQQAASKRVSELFKDDVTKAKKPADKALLAKKLLQAGIDEKNDPVGRYAVLMMARDTAAAAGDADVAIDALEELGKSYQIEPLPLKADALAIAGRSAATPAAQKAIALRADQAIDDAMAADQYDVAKRLADIASSAAHKADDAALTSTAASHAKDVSSSAQAFHEAAKAMTVLQTTPTDEKANLAAGRFRCLVKGDWDGGIPFLARGGDMTLKALAVKETPPPSDVDGDVTLGDDWWNLAAKESGAIRRHMMEHAGKWYNLALPSSGGLVQVKIQRRLAEIGAPPQTTVAGAGPHAGGGACTIELKVDAEIEIGELKQDGLIWSNRKHVFSEIPKNMENLVFNRDRARASPKKFSIKVLTSGYLYFFGEQTDKSLAALKPRLEDLKGAVKGPFVPESLRVRVKQGEEIELAGYEIHIAAASIVVVK